MASLFCILGRHRRSRGRVRREGMQWVSRCRGCERVMRRSYNGKWYVERPVVEAAFTDAPEADQPRRGLKRWLSRIRLPQIRMRQKAQD